MKLTLTMSELKQIAKEELDLVLKEEDDRCTRIAKRKYKVWPSAYASGAVVKCRDGKIWKDLKEEEITDSEEEELKKIEKELNGASKMHKGQAQRIGKVIDERKKNCGCGQDPCITYGIQEKKQSSEDAGRLDKWFGRQGEKGSKGGWVDCNAPDGDGGYKECAQGDRKKKPRCRPTPSACRTDENISKKKLIGIIEEEFEAFLSEQYLDQDLLAELENDPSPSVSCSEFLQREDIGEAKTPAWQRKSGKSKSGGLNRKGRKSYEKENPGSDLKAPVSAKQAKKSKGGKSAKRRKSFCARMCGMKKKKTGAKTKRDPDSRINKALRKWDCNC